MPSNTRAADAAAVVQTIAGDGTCGFRDGPAEQAQIEDICCFALDAAGSLIFTDFGNDRIRKLSADRKSVTTIAGGGNQDYYSRFRNGAAESAVFYGPIGLAIDRVGNVLIADGNNHRVRMLSADYSTVTTICGDGVDGYMDGPASFARFGHPSGIAIDAQGNVIIADTERHRLRRLSADYSTVTTICGDGTEGFRDGDAMTARLNQPRGLAIDRDGNVIFADDGSHRIRMLSADYRTVTTIGGSGHAGFRDGPAIEARLNQPCDVSIDREGTIVFTDYGNGRIRKLSADHSTVTTIAGNGDRDYLDGSPAASNFKKPYGVVIDADGSVVASCCTDRIRLIEGTGLAPGLDVPAPHARFPVVAPVRDLPAVTTSLVMRADARIATLESWITEAESICLENHGRSEEEISAATMAHDAAVLQADRDHVTRVRRSELTQAADKARANAQLEDIKKELHPAKIEAQKSQVAEVRGILDEAVREHQEERASEGKRKRRPGAGGGRSKKGKPESPAGPTSPSDASGGSAASAASPAASSRERPQAHKCALTMEVMEDPVIAADGCTYERAAIEEWLQHHDTSPLHNTVLSHKLLTPNRAVREWIQDWVD
eukprot:m.375381 g.375381  ORF g.375381 m.375381 type:complete len:604 (-) comp28183_c3_seq1:2279-4090(-)